MENYQKLEKVFRNALGFDSKYDVSTLIYNAVSQWDSMAHMRLISELETEFNIMLDTDDILDLSSFVKSREILVKYGVQFGA